jgi:hypothetical protein
MRLRAGRIGGVSVRGHLLGGAPSWAPPSPGFKHFGVILNFAAVFVR